MNNKLIKGVLITVACGSLLTACGSKTIPRTENGQEAIVTFKDDTKISVNDLYDKLKASYGFDNLIEMIDKIILEKEFPNDLEAAKSDAEASIKQLESYYGNQLEAAIQQYTSYKTIDEYKNYIYISYLQEKVALNYAKDQIKNSDINKYYKNDFKSDIKVSHILISVDYAQDATEDEISKIKDEAKSKAQEVLDKLNASDKKDIANKFAELAKEYSDDESTKNDGGNLGFINEDTLGEAYEDLVDAAYEIKDGTYANKIVETELGYNIVFRTETKEKPALSDVENTIKEKLAEEYLQENSAEVYIKSMQELRKNYGMEIVDDELATNYKNYIQNALLNAQSNKDSSSKK